MFMHSYAHVPSILYILIYLLFGTFLIVSLSFSLSLPFTLVVSWHLNLNLLHPGTLFLPGHPLLLMLLLSLSGSMMKRPNRTSLRTFLDKAFILNAKLSSRTSPTPTYPLSSTLGDRGHCVTPRSCVHPC